MVTGKKTKNSLMNIQKYMRVGKDIVVGLDDEVEYLLNGAAAEAIQRGDAEVELIRLYDRAVRRVPVSRIEASVAEKGIIDYLDIR